jgi:hypothetical protein
VFLSFCPPASAATKWATLATANFLFIGDASEGEIREVLTRALPRANTASPVPTTVALGVY